MNLRKIKSLRVTAVIVYAMGLAFPAAAASFVDGTSRIHDEFTAIYDTTELCREFIDGRIAEIRHVAVFNIKEARGQAINQDNIDGLYPRWRSRLDIRNFKQPGKYEGILECIYPNVRNEVAFFWVGDSRVSFSRDDLLNYTGGSGDSGYPRSSEPFGVYVMTKLEKPLAEAVVVTEEDVDAMPFVAPYLGMRVMLKQPPVYLVPSTWADGLTDFLKRWETCSDEEMQRSYLREIYQSPESFGAFPRLAAWLYVIQFTESEKLISQLSSQSFFDDELYLAAFTYGVMRYGSLEEREAFMLMLETSFGKQSDWSKFGLRGLALGAMNASVKFGDVRRSVAINMEPGPRPIPATLRLLTTKIRAAAKDANDVAILNLLRSFADDTEVQPAAKLPDRTDRTLR